MPTPNPLVDIGNINASGLFTANVGAVISAGAGGGLAIIGTVLPRDADLSQTGTAAAGAGVTLTLPAAGVGLFHHITAIEIFQFAAAALTAGAVPVLVTTTNLNNTPTFSLSATALAAGADERFLYTFPNPIKSSAANVATTIVAPATTSVIWRLNCWYYAA
jgi:hypothetical protein